MICLNINLVSKKIDVNVDAFPHIFGTRIYTAKELKSAMRGHIAHVLQSNSSDQGFWIVEATDQEIRESFP